MKGVSVMFAPLFAEPGATITEGCFALENNGVTVATGRAALGEIHDLDDVCRA